MGIERRGQNVHTGEGEQPQGVVAQDRGGEPGRLGVKLSPLEQDADDGHAQHDEAHGGGHTDKEDELQGRAQGLPDFLPLPFGHQTRERGEDHGGERDGEDAQGQLGYAPRIVKVRNASRRQRGGELGIDDKVDLGDPGPEDSRKHQTSHLADSRVGEGDFRPEGHPPTNQGRHLHGELEQPSHEHAPGECEGRAGKVLREQQGRSDDGEIQQNRSEGWKGE